ncbi:MAG TPA: hypothetical protein VFE58_05735 [Tepidisphaeraceae bacterium]|jgi:hypothetical protein|nr:hypothetical protein [Tepidisphaeraceae bacterium]
MGSQKNQFIGSFVALGVLVSSIVLFIILGSVGHTSPEQPEQANQPPSDENAMYSGIRNTPERVAYITSVFNRTDISVTQKNDLCNQYDDAHRDKPLTERQKQIRSEIEAKEIVDAAEEKDRFQNELQARKDHPKITPGSPEEAELRDKVEKWYKEHHLKDDGTPE